MSRRTRSILALTLASAALALSACGSSSHDGSAITVYSGQHEQTTAALVRAFERQTGVAVHVRAGDEAELANQIVQEGANSPADVFYTENTPVLEALREKGLLAAVSPATLATVPSRYDSSQGEWVGVSARVSALVYNTSQLTPSQLPGSILALAQPRWKGKLGFAPSETDFQPLVTSIIKLDGGVVSVMVRGDVSSVRAAVEAGAEAAAKIGELRAAHVIPRPDAVVVRAFAGGEAR